MLTFLPSLQTHYSGPIEILILVGHIVGRKALEVEPQLIKLRQVRLMQGELGILG